MLSLDGLNDRQREAVEATEGPLLILAGAGSGKTRVLTVRTAYLIEEKGVSPYQILAITFTNKAAGEMRDRISSLAGAAGDAVWASTFHSFCVRVLRRYIDRIGYSSNFTIYDADDQKTLIKDVCKRLQIDTKMHKEKNLLNAISTAKDELIGPIDFETQAAGNYTKQIQARVYKEYQRVLHENNALDFDDLINKTVELFKLDAEVLSSYQERFRYIMVDEYQDTNTAQFELVRLLARKYKNLCVVGDDDQSIYKFRGANIYNILNFEKHFPDAKVIKLEQNYRSTQNILDAANAVIANNVGRKDKHLWTEKGSGDKITYKNLEDGRDEAAYVGRDIADRVRRGQCTYRDCAVLYRTNAQSRLFEERFISANIPYRIVGGVNFYARKEIKDLLAYLKTIDNGHDDLAVQRIINVPKRGIGQATIGKAADYALENGMDFYEALCRADEIPGLGRAAAKLHKFVQMIEELRELSNMLPVSIFLEEVAKVTGYREELELEDTDEAKARLENINELISKAADYEETAEEPTLSDFLEEVALVADIDSLEAESDYVVLMTLHSAKGLEFPNVYLTGMEDGLFPSYLSITNGDLTTYGANAQLEEERRLAYVGITRAKEHLTITSASARMIRGETRRNRVSRFVEEIPEELISGNVPRSRYEEDDSEDKYGWDDDGIFGGSRMRRRSSYGSAGYSSGYGSAGYSTAGYGSGYASGSMGAYETAGTRGTEGASHQKAKPPVYTQPTNQRNFQGGNSALQPLTYDVGDRVRHIKFGEGVVTSIVAGGRDYEVTVDFDKAGTKKMFAAFAKLKRI